MVRALADMDLEDEVVLFLYAGESMPDELADSGFDVVEMRTVTGAARAVWEPLSRVLSPRTRGRLRRLASRASAPDSALTGGTSSGRWRLMDPLWRRWFEARGVDLLVFTNENDLAFRTGIPYAVAIHDLQHRLHPEYEEVSADGEAERREYRVGYCVRDATLVLVDSEVGREDMIEFYGPEGVSAEAVLALPFLPADYLGTAVAAADRARVRETYGLPAHYLFYPAQFSPSKNHVRIVEAIGALDADGSPVHLVLAGTHTGTLRERTYAEVLATAERLGVAGLVRDLGYVPDASMTALYAEADALVMPTFFGPTNIPILEAWRVGCPVITSDIRGVRDQAGEAAVLVDPESAESIAQGIKRLVEDPALRETYATRGRERLAAYTREDYTERLALALEVAKQRIAAERDARSRSDARPADGREHE
jgi:glycosyltransferase involved in cell wall biosynthesis